MNTKDFFKQIDQYYSESRFDELEAFLLKNLKTAKESGPSFSIMVLNELGTYYRGATRFEEAIRCFQMAAEELSETVGKESKEYATALNNLGGAYRMAKEADAARACFEEMTGIYELYKDDDPMLYASGINNLALLELSCKNYEAAASGLQKSLEILSGFPEYRWEEATTICNLGICLLKTGQTDTAEMYLLRADEMIREMPESRQGHLAAIQSALGELYLGQNKKEKALAAFETARALLLKHYGKNKDYENVCRIIRDLSG